MDPDRFEALLRAYATPPTRRDALRLVAAAVAAPFLASSPLSSRAKKKGGKGKGGKKKKKKSAAAHQLPSAAAWFGHWQVFHGTDLVPVGDMTLHGNALGPHNVEGVWNDTASPAQWVVEGARSIDPQASDSLDGTFTIPGSVPPIRLRFGIGFSNPEKTEFRGDYDSLYFPGMPRVFAGVKI